jgi:RNA ligase (TIGR02306 family)
METTRALATIAQVAELLPIPGADRVHLARFADRGWQVVVDNATKVGDIGVYFEPDSFLPMLPDYSILQGKPHRVLSDGRQGYRLRTIKLRGVYSEGLFMRFDQLPSYAGAGAGADNNGDIPAGLPTDLPTELGTDVTARLGVLQWPDSSSGSGGASLLQKGGPTISKHVRSYPFPEFIPRTSEMRLENIRPERWQAMLESGDEFEWTEKLDGMSFTAFYDGERAAICSHNQLLEFDANFRPDGGDKARAGFCAVERKHNLCAKLCALGRPIAIQGEVIGPAIQGNRYRRSSYELYAFRAWDIAAQCFVPVREIAEQLGLPLVPVERVAPLPESRHTLKQLSNGASALCPSARREGLVLRSCRDANVSFKAISPEYLSKMA